MNKTAFLALIEHLKKEFTPEKIQSYIRNLENLKTDTSKESINLYKDLYQQKRAFEEAALHDNNQKVQTEETEDGVIEKMDTRLMNLDDTGMLMEQRANAVDHAVACLNWLSELTEKLNGELEDASLEKQMDAVREHFSARYKEMYEISISDGDWNERERLLQTDHLANYYLAPGVVGGPEFDDHTIYWFMKSFSLAISGEVHGFDVSPLQKTLTEAVNKMAYGDLGLDQIVTEMIDSHEEHVPDKDTDLDQHFVDGRKQHYHEGDRQIHAARLAIENQRLPENYLAEEIKDAEKEMADLTRDFFENQMYGKKMHSPHMNMLLEALKKYGDRQNQLNGNLPKQKGRDDFFEKVQKLVDKIRTEQRKTDPKDFHETAEFLNRVDVYSAKMAYLERSTKLSEDHEANLSAEVRRTRVLSNRLFKQLNRLSSGGKSPEFTKMYEALDALHSRTAGSARHLLEQLMDARNAADHYLRAKDEEMLHKTGVRYTGKGQARYDSAENIRDMLDTALRPYILAYQKHPHLNFNKHLDPTHPEYRINEDKLSADSFSYPKEHFLHKAGHALAVMEQSRRVLETVENESNIPKSRYDTYVEQYFYNMDLADHPEKRRKMSARDEAVNGLSIGRNQFTYQLEVVRPYFKYFAIAQSGGFDFTAYNDLFYSMSKAERESEAGKQKIRNSEELRQLIADGMNEKTVIKYDMNGQISKVIPMLGGHLVLPAEYIENIYQQVSRENKYLKSIEKMSLQEARKIKADTAGMEKSVKEFADSFGFDNYERTVESIANRARIDRMEALDKRIEELTLEREQIHDLNRSSSIDSARSLN